MILLLLTLFAGVIYGQATVPLLTNIEVYVQEDFFADELGELVLMDPFFFEIDHFFYTADVQSTDEYVRFAFESNDDRFWVEVWEFHQCAANCPTVTWDDNDALPHNCCQWALPDTIPQIGSVYNPSAVFELNTGDNIFVILLELQEENTLEYFVNVIRASDVQPTGSPVAQPTNSPIQSTVETTQEPGGDGIVALPEQSPESPVCDERDEILVELIAQEANATGASAICSDMTVQVEANEELMPDDMCACFIAADNKEYLYPKNCRPNNATLYTFSDAAYYCFGEEAVLEGPTDISYYFDKTEDTFDTSDWSGTDDEFIYPGQKLRQTYVGNDMDATTGDTSNYMLVEFDTCAYGNWEEGDAIQVEIDYTTVFTYEVPAGSHGTTDGECSSHSIVVPLVPYFSPDSTVDEHEFTIGFTSNLAGDDEYFDVTPTKLETMTRRDLSDYCVEIGAYNASVNYPIFIQESTGFLYNYDGSGVDSRGITNSLRLHFEAEVPRHLYDFTIDFDNGNGEAGYSEGRTLANYVVDKETETYWTSDLLTDDTIVLSTLDNCGYETWTADIPWHVFNEGLAGGVVQIEDTYNNGTGETVVDDEYYVYGATAKFTGSETIDASNGGRTWITSRYSQWRVPFLVRWERTVMVDEDVEIILCPDTTTTLALCTLNSVAAIVEQIQANTVYDLSSQDYRADVNLKINTLVLYPYIFVTGNNTDDPPTYWETYGQEDIYPPPLEGGVWSPPSVDFVPADHVPADTLVETTFTYLGENRDECTFINDNDISTNLNRECPQFWNLYIVPLNGACYIDGDYTVTWTARCFYDKPTCSFNDDEDGNMMNTVAVVFKIHSTNMCPEIVHEVDLYGEMCATGRYDYHLCEEAEANVPGEDVSTYFQNEAAHFFMKVESDSARIIYTKIIEIWTNQDFVTGEWPIDDSATALDYNFNNLVKLWDETTGFIPHSFTSSLTDVATEVDNVIVETMDSNDFAAKWTDIDHGTGETDLGQMSGFEVFLDSRIFPRDSDRWLDATFRVKLLVWYEGWGDYKALERRNLEEGEEYPIDGSKTLWMSKDIRIARRKPVFVPCYKNKENAFWTITLEFTDQQLDFYRLKLDELLDFEMKQLLGEENIGLLGYTFDALNQNKLVAVYKVNDNSIWDEATKVFGNYEFGSTLLLKEATTSDFFCMDAPEDTTITALTACAKGEPCEFLPGHLHLEDYYGQGFETNSVEVQSSSSMTFLTFACLVAAILL